MSEEKKVIIMDKKNMDDVEVQKLLEENDVNVDGESNITVFQCIAGC